MMKREMREELEWKVRSGSIQRGESEAVRGKMTCISGTDWRKRLASEKSK